MIKIVLTCTNKAIKNKLIYFAENKLREELTPLLNINVVVLPDPKDNIMKIAPAPLNNEDAYSLENEIIKTQINAENAIKQLIKAKNYDSANTVVIFGRGLLDGVKEIGENKLYELLATYNLSKEDVLKRYDVVFHFTKTKNKANQDIQNIWSGCKGYTNIDVNGCADITKLFLNAIKSLVSN